MRSAEIDLSSRSLFKDSTEACEAELRHAQRMDSISSMFRMSTERVSSAMMNQLFGSKKSVTLTFHSQPARERFAGRLRALQVRTAWSPRVDDESIDCVRTDGFCDITLGWVHERKSGGRSW